MHKNFIAVVFLAFSPLLPAQLSPRNEDIVKMVKAGLGEDLIITTINASPGYYDTSPAGLASLRTAGVTDKELSALVHKAFQICFAGTGQEQLQSLDFPEMVKMLQDTGCGPHSVAPASSAQAAPAPFASPVATASANALAPEVEAPSQQPPSPAQSASKPRVFVTLANTAVGQGAPQEPSIPMSKDFAQSCPAAQVAIDQKTADYTIVFDLIQGDAPHDGQVRIANKDGNLISNFKESEAIDSSVKKACNAIVADWAGK